MDEVHDKTAESTARMLYAIAMAAGCASSGEGPFVYDKDLDAFCFPGGGFAFDREVAHPWLAKALGLQR